MACVIEHRTGETWKRLDDVGEFDEEIDAYRYLSVLEAPLLYYRVREAPDGPPPIPEDQKTFHRWVRFDAHGRLHDQGFGTPTMVHEPDDTYYIHRVKVTVEHDPEAING